MSKKGGGEEEEKEEGEEEEVDGRSFAVWLRVGIQKNSGEKSGLLPNLPRPPPLRFGLFTKKIDP